MSEPDEYDKLTAELLPCEFAAPELSEVCNVETGYCYSCNKRPAVAAALRAQGVEIERLKGAIAYDRFHAEAEIAQLKAKIDHYIKESFDNLAEAEKENAQLKAKIATAKQDAEDNYTQGKKWGIEHSAIVAERYGSSYIAQHIRAAMAEPGKSGE